MNLYECILFFTILVSVFHIISRIFFKFGQKHTKLKTLIVFLVWLLCFLLQKHVVLLLCVAFIPLFLLFLLQILTFYLKKSKNLENYLSFVERLTLKVQNQQSFLQSLRELSAESDAFMQQNAFIYDYFVLFSTQKPKNLDDFQQSVFEKLQFLKNKPHQIQVYLEEWLEEEKQITFFRHKSSQMSFQARFQAGIIFGIYIVLFIYQCMLVGSKITFVYVKWSFPLLILGFYLMYRILRGFRWKI